ncbi:GH92 family glycosyl hydrolase [Butyricimonas synergistica]|uniref:GH92 family glycosyl hydrolase n=1 Tax=Butyricimonas synergistica TaxID=544644 RepID=UPI00039CD3CC|nr:GH92 family glycosyl hydrolase [Butyricimonas synergistica]
MRTLVSLFLLISLLYSCQEENRKKQPVDWVDTQIGSVHCRWFFYTPAALPMGMAKLAPTTNAYGSYGSWLPCGYDDRHSSIEGFAHFHEFQIGGVVTIPTTGTLKTLPGSLENPDEGYRSRIDKKTEYATPGYYSVNLTDYNIKAELTATTRTGFHRYTFPASAEARILFDIGHKQGESATVTDAEITYHPENNEVTGWVENYPIYATFCQPDGKVKIYFAAKIDKKPESVGTFINDKISENTNTTHGVGCGLFLNFYTKEREQIQMQMGLSYTSIENARNNRETEAANKTFDDVKNSARNTWNEMLGRIQVEGGTNEDKTKFYTGLYHALLGRGISNDINGQFIQHDRTIGQIPLDEKGQPLYSHHNTDGMWGGFWNLTQVWTLAYPEIYSGYVKSNLDFYKNSGWLHDGEAAGVYTNGVQTNFQGLVICAAYQAGIRDFDIPNAWDAVRKNELGYIGRDMGKGKYDNEYFIKGGYVPLKDYHYPNGWTCNFGASHTLEYAFSCYAAAQLAKALGKTAEHDTLMHYSYAYKKLFDPETKYMRPREEDGTFMQDFDPMKGWKGFQEGNAAQYTWYVPHDIKGLIDLMGLELFNERLENTFTESRHTLFGGGKEIDSFSGVEKLYNQGNQPCLHDAWLFNYSGKPWLTQLYTRLLCDEFYGVTPEHGYGYGQDEDQGQLGAWYVLAAMGLFDVQGGTNITPSYQIGSPKFSKITIKLNPKYYSGKEFVIETENSAPENYYVQSATLNGKPLENCWFYRKEIMKGGHLKLKMDSVPNTRWGIASMPYSK